MLKIQPRPETTLTPAQLRSRGYTAKQIITMRKNALGASGTAYDWSDYEDRPGDFLREALGFEPTPDQEQIANSVRDSSETNVQSCHGAGKSALAAGLALWWVFAVGGECITTAPTARQVDKIIWKEIRQRYDNDRPKLGGTRLKQELRLSQVAFAWGFTARDGDSNAAQGAHSPKLLIIVDEACGVDPAIDDGLVSCLTGANNHILRIGNPILAGTAFEDACKRSHIHIPVWGHPNILPYYERHDDGIHRLIPGLDADDLPEKIPGAVTPRWVETIRESKGDQSSYWRTRVEALFPLDAANAVFPRTFWDAARDLYDADPDHWRKVAQRSPVRIALDVGDGGDDSAIAIWRGPVLTELDILPGRGDRLDVDAAADWLIGYLKRNPGAMAIVDQGGVGAGALAKVLKAGFAATHFGWGERPTNAGQKSNPFEKFENRKAEQFWQLRQAGQQGQIAIAPLGDFGDRAADDLAAHTWFETKQEKICICPKKEVRSKLGRSPDAGDVVVAGYAGAVAGVPLSTQRMPNYGALGFGG